MASSPSRRRPFGSLRMRFASVPSSAAEVSSATTSCSARHASAFITTKLQTHPLMRFLQVRHASDTRLVRSLAPLPHGPAAAGAAFTRKRALAAHLPRVCGGGAPPLCVTAHLSASSSLRTAPIAMDAPPLSRSERLMMIAFPAAALLGVGVALLRGKRAHLDVVSRCLTRTRV